MNKKHLIINISVAIVFFVLGFLARMFIMEATDKGKEEKEVADIKQDDIYTVTEVDVRIREGYVEWFDGTTWNKVESVDALQAEDSYFLAQEGLNEFESQYASNLEKNNLALVEEESIVMGAPLVGVDNQSSTGAGTYTPSQSTTTNTPSTSTSTTPNTNTTEPPSAEPPSTEAPSTTEAPSNTESQDGEDIGWSDDYL